MATAIHIPDVLSTTAGPSLDAHGRPLPMSDAPFQSQQEGSSTRPRSRNSSKRLDSSTSSALSSSNGIEISSDQLFVKIPPSTDTRAGHPSPLRAPNRQLESGKSPLRPLRPGSRFPASNEPDELQHEMVAGHSRQRTLSSGAAPATRLVVDVQRGRQTQSENGDQRWGRRPRVLSLPRQAFKTSSNSDSSEQPSPLTPSAFNDIPPMPVFHTRRNRHQHQDSGATQQSATSSSIYPRSSSTGTDSYLSPPSLPSNDADHHIIAVDPEDNIHLQELNEMDADDVSYRLRLLMRNNYYLPPAHLKPFDYSPVSESPKKSPIKPSVSPTTFFDIFKVGKLRSKGATPDQKGAPILRTTGDDSTVSGIGRPHHPRVPSNQPQHLHLNVGALPARPRADNNKKGRVVVVRERMDDIETAAKQVEQDLKIREAERRKAAVAAGGSRASAHQDPDADDKLPSGDPTLIDPTDCVDLPRAALGSYILDPQSSEANRIGVESSVGAAALADALPPHSPGVWSVDSEEEAWRKALLQEAVGHSLNNSPAASPVRKPPIRSQNSFLDLGAGSKSGSSAGNSGSTPVGNKYVKRTATPTRLSPLGASTGPQVVQVNGGTGGVSASGVPTARDSATLSLPGRKRELGQRILSRMMNEDEIAASAEADGEGGPGGKGEDGMSVLQRKPSEATSINRSLRVSSIGSNVVPLRAETPTAPTYPLAPPPRKFGQPLSPAISSSDSPTDGELPFLDATDNLIEDDDRAEMGSPTDRLTDSHETHIGLSGAFGEPSPPFAGLSPPPHSSPASSPGYGRLSSVTTTAASISSGSHYSYDNDEDDDGNTAFHTPLENTTVTSFAKYDGDASRPSLTVSVTPSESARTSSEYSRPSPTTSAFRDALDYSLYSDSRRGSVANTLGGRRSVSRGPSRFGDDEDVGGSGSRVPSRLSEEVYNAHYEPVIPPPRTSSSLSRNVLYPPPLSRFHPRPSYDTIRNVITSQDVPESTRESLDKSSERSLTPEAEPSTPLARPHPPPETSTLTIPEFASTTSPYPSPIAFFDAVEMQSRPEDDESDDEGAGPQVAEAADEDEEDEDEEEELELDEDALLDDDDDDLLGPVAGYQSDAIPRSLRSVRPILNTSQSFTQLRNHSSPHLRCRESRAISDVGYGYNRDTWRAIASEPPAAPPAQPSRSSFSLTRIRGKSKGKGVTPSAWQAPPDPPRASTSSSVFERLRLRTISTGGRGSKQQRPGTAATAFSSGAVSENDAHALKPPHRPWTAGTAGTPGPATVGNWRDDQNKQNQSMRRLDGMLIEHMERERDILKRITTTLSSKP